MNALVVYHSRFGNTKRVAEEIADTLRSSGSVRVMPADELPSADIDDIDLLVAGTPTHVANLPKDLRPVLDALPKRMLAGVQVAAFDTSYKMNRFVSLFTAARPLARKLQRLGGKRAVSPQSFFVVEKQGPLHEGEIERARGWAETIRARMRAASRRGHVRLQ
jgi:flavodoxin